MKKFMILAILAVALSGCGSDRSKKTNEVAQNDVSGQSGSFIIGCPETILPLLNKWKQEFVKNHAKIKIGITPVNSGKILNMLENNQIQIAVLSGNDGRESFWTAPVAKDAVLPVVSFDNNNLQQIVLSGITKEKLAAAFTGKLKTWRQLLQAGSNDPIEVFKLSDSSGSSAMWAEFLKVKPSDFKGTLVFNENDIPMMVAGNKNAIGYCSFTDIYDINTGLKKRNLYVLPVDLNSNNQTDDNELVFDKIGDLKSAVASGKYPSPPGRKFYMACKKAPDDRAITSFIKWILTIGQSYCDQYGFVTIEKNEASVSLKQME
ncbi:MAG TPA: substrate-binding domain-containing protein [Bacteroidales bacterium]|nr:substrate-binding domain-containing protein [Bacteroidales bacterium]